MSSTNGHGLKRTVLYARVSTEELRREFDEHGTKIRALNDRGDDSPEGGIDRWYPRPVGQVRAGEGGGEDPVGTVAQG